MCKKLYLFSFSLLFALAAFAQQADPVVFTIDGKPVYKSEVEKAYKKSNEIAEEKESVRDFTDSYINFRLNVEEAKAGHLDTLISYTSVFDSYKSQVAAPYLKDTVSESLFIEKIYKRLLENIELNHVMIPFEKNVVFPADTVTAYAEIMALREKILKNGFVGDEFNSEKAALSMVANLSDRNGYIGWISPFSLPSKVEDAAYSLPLKEISMPIRSPRGYHIIQVLDRRAAIGSVELEQVLFGFPHIPPTEHDVDSVGKVAMREYDKLHSTADYDMLCQKFSQVHGTGDKGCYFGIIDLGSSLPSDFVNAAFNLQNPGDVSKPVMTNYGYHIIRLIKKRPVAPFNEAMKQQLKARMLKTDKMQELSDEKRQRLIGQFHVETSQGAYEQLNDVAGRFSPRDSLFVASVTNGDDILLDIEGKRIYPVKEFVKYIQRRQTMTKVDKADIQMFQVEEATPYTLSTDILKEYYDNFVTILVSDFASYTLEDRVPEFRDLINDFSDQLLVFEVLDRNIWKRSKSDKKGLSQFFTENRDSYSLDTVKYKGVIIQAKDKDALKKAEAIARKEKDTSRLIPKLRERLNKDSILIRTESGSWAKGENKYVDYEVFGGENPEPHRNYPYFFVTGKFIEVPEDYTDVRNAVELDYQAKLEKDWYLYLRNKYKVDVDESVLETIK